MRRSRRLTLSATALCAAALGLSACGTESIDVPPDSRFRQGAELFATHCSGCHTMKVVGTEGSAVSVGTREYKDGPNFDQRQESAEDVLFAIRNGGFSSGPMPQQIVTGEQAQAVADFVAEYSGSEAERPRSPQAGTP